MFEYAATVLRVVDGDTIVMDVDLGFGVWLREQHFRLLGLNAREKGEAGGREARSNLSSLMPPGREVVISSVKADKFGGRYDAQIKLSDGSDLSTLLIQTGWAAAWTGDGLKPVPPWPRKAP